MKAIDRLKMIKERLKAKKEERMRIKNLKVRNVKKGRRYTLIKGAIIGLLIVGTISGCSFGHKSDASRVPTYQSPAVVSTVEQPPEDEYSYESMETIAKDNIVGNVSTTNITYDETNYAFFKDYSDKYNVGFSFEDNMNYEAATTYFEENEERVATHSGSGVIVDGKVDEDKLFDLIEVNSPIFKKDKHHYMYTIIDDAAVIRKIISYVAESINEDLPNKTPEQIAELDCVLSNLTMFFGTGTEAAKVTTEGALLVNEPMIRAMKVTTGNDDTYRNIIFHESKHLEQIDCVDRKDNIMQHGISRSTDALDVNPYRWQWSTEAAAEKGSIDMTGDAPTTYNYLVGYLETLDLLRIVSPNANSQSVATIVNNRDIGSFYKAMGIDNGITQKEIVSLMYANEIMQNRVDGFFDSFTPEQKDEYRNNLRKEFLLEASKIFYTNLSALLKGNNQVTEEDIYYLITVFEGDMNYHLTYSSNQNFSKEYIQEFLREYNEIQSNFFSSLAITSGKDCQTYFDALNSYGMYTTDGKINASFSWLNDEQLSDLVGKATSDRITYTTPINYIVSHTERLTK